MVLGNLAPWRWKFDLGTVAVVLHSQESAARARMRRAREGSKGAGRKSVLRYSSRRSISEALGNASRTECAEPPAFATALR